MALTKPSTTAISGRRLRGLRGSSPAKREVSCARPVSGRAGSQDLFYDSTPVGKTFGRGVFLSQWLAFPVFPFPLFRIPPACRTARFVLWPGAGTKKPPGNRRFDIAKEALISRLRTERTVKDGVLWSYIRMRDLGLTEPRGKQIFEKAQQMTLADVKAAQEKWVKGRKYVYGILGDIQDLDLNYLKTLGPIQTVTQEEIFGY